ncbi:MAG: Smr/MutS family protein [Alphaproteobacteria bacterium]|nr:Smr/MutS family protein [Alphaproteobacteria bacterium]
MRGDDAKNRAAPSLDRRTVARLKRGEMPVEARLDLHGLTQAAAHRALVRFIAEAAADGARLALVITGKGRGGEGVLREAAPRWLAEPAIRAHILAVAEAPLKLGGGGALCVLLRRRRERTAGP